MSNHFQIAVPYEASPTEVKRHPKAELILEYFSSFTSKTYFTYTDQRADGAKGINASTVAVLGQTGYGKSSLLNTLVNMPAFESDAVKACTRIAQSADLLIKQDLINEGLSFLDLPGIGESTHAEHLTKKLYHQSLEFVNVILFVLRADKRDHERDLYLWNELIRPTNLPVICVLNAIDKIEPLHRGYQLSSQQKLNLKEKQKAVSQLFGIEMNKIHLVSSTEGWGIDSLWDRIVTLLRVSTS